MLPLEGETIYESMPDMLAPSQGRIYNLGVTVSTRKSVLFRLLIYTDSAIH